MLKLNLGSGSSRIEGFTNVDMNTAEDIDVFSDVQHLPFFDSTVDEIYASHILEHLPYNSAVLSEWARVLCPGGLCTVVVPDPIATYYAWRHECAVWGKDAHPVDLQYLNACCFGGKVLGGEWDQPGQYHQQVFFYDMLVERMRGQFPDAQQVAWPVVGGQRVDSWLCETTVQGHNGKEEWIAW